MGTVGFSGIGGSYTSYNGVSNAPRGSLNNTYTAMAGDILTKISVYGRKESWDHSDDLEVQLYSVVAGTLNTRLDVIIPISITSATDGWFHSADLNIVLVEGTTYAVAMAFTNFDAGHSFRTYYDTEANQASLHNVAGALPATWVEGSKTAFKYSLYATYTQPGTNIGQILNGRTIKSLTLGRLT